MKHRKTTTHLVYVMQHQPLFIFMQPFVLFISL